MSTPDAPEPGVSAAARRRRPTRALLVGVLALTILVVSGAVGVPAVRQRRASAEPVSVAVRSLTQAPSPTPAASPGEPSPTPEDGAPADVTFEIYSVRDPFAQLVSPPGAEGGGGETGTGTGTGTATTGTGTGATTTGTGTGATTGTGTGTTTGTGTGSSTGSPATPSPGSTATPGATPTTGATELDAIQVELVDTFVEDGAHKALVAVNGQGYEVAQQQDFANGFTLLAVDSPCVTLSYEGRRFVLCEGDEILK